MINQDQIVEIGKFLKPHALKGELNALLDVDFDYATDGNPLVVDIDGIFVPFFAESVRPKGTEAALIKLKGVDSQDKAREFVNKEIYGIRENLMNYFDLAEDEIVDDFMDFKIIDSKLGVIGTVVDIDDSTANVLFVVETPGNRTVYIPVADEFIDNIDNERKIIETTLPQGILDI